MFEIIDMPMGTGKTTGLINYMNSNPQKKYMFITPFLDEVQRIKDSCPDLNFKEPEDKYSKLNDLKRLIAEQENIVSTHALFNLIDKSLYNVLESVGYTLVLDEVIEAIEPINYKPMDVKKLVDSKIISIAEDGKVTAINNKYASSGLSDSPIIRKIRNQNVYFIDDTLLLCIFNPEIFPLFREKIILTYLFKGSLMQSYLKIFHFDWEYYNIKDNEILKGKYDDLSFRTYAKKHIKIYTGKLNDIGDKDNSLSSTWYKSSKQKESRIILKNNLYNYFVNIEQTKNDVAMWSTLIGINERIKNFMTPKGYKTDCFVPCNARATNKFDNKKSLAYCVNVYVNPFILKYLLKNDIELEQDLYALSQMVQWIWRSSIRKGEEVNIYIPSKRMRNILIRWMNGEFEDC